MTRARFELTLPAWKAGVLTNLTNGSDPFDIYNNIIGLKKNNPFWPIFLLYFDRVKKTTTDKVKNIITLTVKNKIS